MLLSILTISSKSYWELFKLTTPNKLNYCLKYGFTLHAVHSENVWRQKLQLDVLKYCDWLWFLGADTIITNYNIDAKSLCYSNADFVIGLDEYGINNDSFFIRNCPKSMEFLTKVLFLLNRSYPNDQEAMKQVIKDMPEYRVKIVNQKLLNSYYNLEYGRPLTAERGNWEKGDLVLHTPGIHDISRRYEILKNHLDLVIL